MGLEPEILTTLVARSAQDKKAHDIIILDLKELSAITDYFVICHGTSDRQVVAIAEAIEERLSKNLRLEPGAVMIVRRLDVSHDRSTHTRRL